MCNGTLVYVRACVRYLHNEGIVPMLRPDRKLTSERRLHYEGSVRSRTRASIRICPDCNRSKCMDGHQNSLAQLVSKMSRASI